MLWEGSLDGVRIVTEADCNEGTSGAEAIPCADSYTFLGRPGEEVFNNCE